MNNSHRTEGDTTFIELTGRDGGVVEAAIDTADLPLVSSFPGRWYVSAQGYVHMNTPRSAGRRTSIRLHKTVCPTSHGTTPDHIDLDRLNNRRANLRPATRLQNACNRMTRPTNRSGYKGVTALRSGFLAKIFHDGTHRHLGCFRDPVSAARAYDDAARELFGPFARLNFPQSGEQQA